MDAEQYGSVCTAYRHHVPRLRSPRSGKRSALGTPRFGATCCKRFTWSFSRMTTYYHSYLVRLACMCMGDAVAGCCVCARTMSGDACASYLHRRSIRCRRVRCCEHAGKQGCVPRRWSGTRAARCTSHALLHRVGRWCRDCVSGRGHESVVRVLPPGCTPEARPAT